MKNTKKVLLLTILVFAAFLLLPTLLSSCIGSDGISFRQRPQQTTAETTCDHEHQYTSSIIAPTEISHGYTEFTCSICGISYLGDFISAPKTSKSLIFSDDRGDGTCFVDGIGSCTDTFIVIPFQSPSGLKVAGVNYRAFQNCTQITGISIPVTATKISGYSFQGCTSLEKIELADNILSVGSQAFEGCKMLKSVIIGNNIGSIQDNTFSNCISLADVTFGAKLEKISTNAFYNCKALKSVTVSAENEFYTSQNGVLFDKLLETLIIYPATKPETTYKIPDSVTSITDNAFQLSQNLRTVVFSQNLESIGNAAFQACTGLVELTFPEGLKTIGTSAFTECHNMETVKFSNSIEEIGDSAFFSCKKLTTLTFPQNLLTLGSGAFMNCTGLKTLIFFDKIDVIKDHAFANCTSLASVCFTGSEDLWGRVTFGLDNKYLLSAALTPDYKQK